MKLNEDFATKLYRLLSDDYALFDDNATTAITALVEREMEERERLARVDELERICELSKSAYKNYLGDWPLFNKRIARLKLKGGQSE